MSSDDQDEVATWLKIVLNIIGTLGGLICLIGGLIGLISAPVHITEPLHIISDVLMLVLGFVMLVFECTFIMKHVSFAEPLVKLTEKLQFWQKGMIYGGSCIIIAALHFSIAQIGWVSVAFACGTLYAFISLGKKASRSDMMANARGVDGTESNVNYANFD